MVFLRCQARMCAQHLRNTEQYCYTIATNFHAIILFTHPKLILLSTTGDLLNQYTPDKPLSLFGCDMNRIESGGVESVYHNRCSGD